MSDIDPVPVLRRSRAASRQAWIERLQRFATANLSVADFCRAEGVATQTFYYWRNKLNAPQPSADSGVPESPCFLPVRLLTQQTPVELLLPGGAVVRLSPGCDLAFVRALLDALGETPC